ncbi:unnamed protein product [Ilex paraguariensis]|uniref:Uncharacterized protein n=1 Tax=Ilex paraguariensis TaxID=185542 RepID=A0ABC8QSE0_9AQUA
MRYYSNRQDTREDSQKNLKVQTKVRVTLLSQPFGTPSTLPVKGFQNNSALPLGLSEPFL